MPPQMVLAFTGLFNLYFHEFVCHGHNLILWFVERAGLENVVSAARITLDLGTLKILIPLITLAGEISSSVLLKKIPETHDISKLVHKMHQGIIRVVTFLFLLIL